MSINLEIQGHAVNQQNSMYIGDGVYAHVDLDNRLWVFTTNGYRVLNEVCLENEVFQNLCKFYDHRVLGSKNETREGI